MTVPIHGHISSGFGYLAVLLLLLCGCVATGQPNGTGTSSSIESPAVAAEPQPADTEDADGELEDEEAPEQPLNYNLQVSPPPVNYDVAPASQGMSVPRSLPQAAPVQAEPFMPPLLGSERAVVSPGTRQNLAPEGEFQLEDSP